MNLHLPTPLARLALVRRRASSSSSRRLLREFGLALMPYAVALLLVIALNA